MNHNITIALVGTVITSVLITLGQVLWKLGISKSGGFYISDQSLLINLQRVLFNPYVLLGFVLYGIATVVFMYLISNYQVSFIIPISSISYIFALIAGRYVFGEVVEVPHIIGVILIMGGVSLIAIKYT